MGPALESGREYEERQTAREESLRTVVPTATDAYLACGRLGGGFAQSVRKQIESFHELAFTPTLPPRSSSSSGS